MNARSPVTAILALLALGPGAVTAQHHSPYAGQVEGREIKALSPEEVDGLLAGDGLGFALPAELNGYPGPRHVLELAGPLGLDGEQESAVRSLFEDMQARAVEAGTRLVALERELEDRLARREVDTGSLEELLGRIEAARADVRFSHLSAHLRMMEILTESQIAVYPGLRGYGHGGAP